MNPITVFLVIVCVAAGVVVADWVNLYVAFVFFAAAILIGLSLKMANVWQKLVILRVGKLRGVRGAGFFAIVPLLDRMIAVIERATLAITDYRSAIDRVAQTSDLVRRPLAAA